MSSLVFYDQSSSEIAYKRFTNCHCIYTQWNLAMKFDTFFFFFFYFLNFTSVRHMKQCIRFSNIFIFFRVNKSHCVCVWVHGFTSVCEAEGLVVWLVDCLISGYWLYLEWVKTKLKGNNPRGVRKRKSVLNLHLDHQNDEDCSAGSPFVMYGDPHIEPIRSFDHHLYWEWLRLCVPFEKTKQTTTWRPTFQQPPYTPQTSGKHIFIHHLAFQFSNNTQYSNKEHI